MFTAKITDKKEEGATLAITVEFSDGVDTYTEVVRPQDEAGFKYFVRQRCESLTTAKKLRADDNVGKEVVVTEPELPQAEKDRLLWLERDAVYGRVLYAVDRGYLTGTETKVKQLETWLKANFKPEYVGIV